MIRQRMEQAPAIPRDLPAAIVVMGVSGSGKSTLASLLATRLGATFIEGDALHEAGSIAKMRAGPSATPPFFFAGEDGNAAGN